MVDLLIVAKKTYLLDSLASILQKQSPDVFCWPVTFNEKKIPAQVLLCEFYETFKNNDFIQFYQQILLSLFKNSLIPDNPAGYLVCIWKLFT